MMDKPLTTQILLQAYATGIFPMAESAQDDEIFWVDPKMRGILPLDSFHISRTLKRQILRDAYTIRTNSAFLAVVRACADRTVTWINDPIFALYLALHHQGYAHSLELWDGADIVGGVYGVALGGAFFGESMFSRRTDASKVALAYLVDHLRQGGFTLFDTQFLTPHLESLGGIEISRDSYRQLLRQALEIKADFNHTTQPPSAAGVIQRNSQTS